MKEVSMKMMMGLIPLLGLAVGSPEGVLTGGLIGAKARAANMAVVESPYVQPGGRLGHWGVGNGGDYLRIGFARAREHAANIVSRLSAESLRTVQDEAVRTWILEKKALLAADILAAKHIWEMDAKPTCGWTVMPEPGDPVPLANPIQLSYPTCRDKVKSFYEATQLLIHESVHHFGEGEDMADKVAIAVVDAWREGRIEWLSINTDDAPSPRQKHSAVWTGDTMVVFGGYDSSQNTSLGDGAVYQPSTDSWAALPELQGLKPRHFHSAHWTGESMIVWGGYQRVDQTETWQYDGFIWNPETKAIETISKPSWWTPQSSTWVFDPRQQTVWTGDELWVWGGIDHNGVPLGGRYNPKTRQWSDLNQGHPAAPSKIAGHSMVWTGEKLIVWGGYEGVSGSTRTISQSGAIFDPSTQTWQGMNDSNAPSARAGHQAFWNGSKMIVFSGGGVSSQRELKGTGGLYNPNTDTWSSLATEMVIERVGHSAVWNGHELLVYGGRSNRLRTYFGEVYNFDPASGRWSGVNSQFTPVSRWYHTAIWTGSSLIIWGGNQGIGSDLADGGIYYP
ncbi:Kelch repeat-containing protein [Pseudobacteriovorax antillogorgiicola]|uniref:Galactose oxidase, central domain n=1 Tax=Pseudobacteriovorax antillogorgiicola TaxID=1513793 RepID=A0A1Y6BEY4_9BACT|nr:kelch-like protein [Pseudobacteriovorax antillogorgiicola]TCS58525.1 galactose oxidase-like protein [Pseudobacteriovorax antillogorgiicola]SME97961.1 Galactose oxidase, central domain [Pseudobacteriovorax antillogorgiicola]